MVAPSTPWLLLRPPDHATKVVSQNSPICSGLPWNSATIRATSGGLAVLSTSRISDRIGPKLPIDVVDLIQVSVLNHLFKLRFTCGSHNSRGIAQPLGILHRCEHGWGKINVLPLGIIYKYR
ncbi:uncharacterized protein DMAD_00175 [Drosophila madeirensis]|uniref:Uncharacterized protein n=1 Tax=Drosophila madeirensis TaxID=30013 RepID=A0AAU9FVE3_DROMD